MSEELSPGGRAAGHRAGWPGLFIPVPPSRGCWAGSGAAAPARDARDAQDAGRGPCGGGGCPPTPGRSPRRSFSIGEGWTELGRFYFPKPKIC